MLHCPLQGQQLLLRLPQGSVLGLCLNQVSHEWLALRPCCQSTATRLHHVITEDSALRCYSHEKLSDPTKICRSFVSEWSVVFGWLHGGDLALFHDHGEARHAQDADVDCRCLSLQEFLYHLWHVSARVLLCPRWDNLVRYCQVWGGNRKVGSVCVDLFSSQVLCGESLAKVTEFHD